jgi:hypothetical protein
MADTPESSIHEEQLKEAERRIAEMRAERDEARNMAQRMEEHVRDADALIDSWIESFEMQLGDDGTWKWHPDLIVDDLQTRYFALLKQWNKFVGKYNQAVAPKEIGRPLDASPAQCAQVLKLKKAGRSLRNIADEMSLGLQTVRTIIGREARTDRTSVKRLERVDPQNTALAAWRARKRTGDALPKRIGETLQQGAALLKEAKGLGR